MHMYFADFACIIFYLTYLLSISCKLENTLHRYPWLCSVRSKDASPQHYCAVNLLSRPPGPAVLVGPAHCTYLCKSTGRKVDNCCCGGPNSCSENEARCGYRPTVVEMTGEDAEILCGEWQTGDTPSASSGEQYNIVLNILEIIRHPDYNSSSYLVNDVAVFKVNDLLLNQVHINLVFLLITKTCLSLL